MAKISNMERHKYFEKIKVYKASIDMVLKREQHILQLAKKETDGVAFKKLSLVDEMLSLASYHIIINGVSQVVLKVRDENALNEARKALNKSIIYLEDIVTSYIDAPFSDYEEKLNEIETIGAAQRYLIARKMGLAIQLLENSYGDNTKWRWSFVEMEGRYATVVKNLMNLRTAVANTDPRSPDYEPTLYHLKLIKRLLNQAADRYREKYELSTSRIDDFKQGILFVSALKRIHTILGEREDADNAKKKYDIWSAKLEADQKKQQGRPQ